MKVNYNPNSRFVPFCDIAVGDVFEYEGKCHLKIAEQKNGKGMGAFDLQDNIQWFVCDGIYVVKKEATIDVS